MFNVPLVWEGLCPERNRPESPAAISISLTLSVKEEEPEEEPPDHWIFIPHVRDEMVLQRETKPLGAGESWQRVSQAQGLFVTKAVTREQVAIGICLLFKRQVHG